MAPGRSRILHLAETASTNADALRLALAGERGPLWVAAERQTGGRGRSGRSWDSGEGNLMASHLAFVAGPLARAGQLSLVAGVAVIDAIDLAAGRAIEGLRLKWPNDVLVGAAKAGGILVETASATGAGGYPAVIGIGVNLARHPQGLERPVTSLAAQGARIEPGGLLDALDATLPAWLALWDGGEGFADVRSAYLARSLEVGVPITVNTGGGAEAGLFAGIDADGALLMRQDGSSTPRRFAWGDVDLASGDRT